MILCIEGHRRWNTDTAEEGRKGNHMCLMRYLGLVGCKTVSTEQFDMVRYSKKGQYSMVWYGMVWYVVVKFGTVQKYSMVQYKSSIQ